MKATLLYADRVKLCSPGSSILSGIAEFQELSPEAKTRLVVRFLRDLQPSMSPEEIRFFEAVVGLRSRAEKQRIDKRMRKRILGMVKEKRGELEAMVLEQHRAAGIEGFREAVRSGLLEVHPFRRTSAEAVVEATITLQVEVLKGLGIDGPVLFPLEEDLPYLAKPLTDAERARALALARAHGMDAIEESLPISVVGTGPDLNSATDNGLARAAALLEMTVPEVANRATVSGAIEIDRHPGVVRVTFRAPVDRLASCGLLVYAVEQYGPTSSGGRPVGRSEADGAEETSAARPGTEDGTVPSGA